MININRKANVYNVSSAEISRSYNKVWIDARSNIAITGSAVSDEILLIDYITQEINTQPRSNVKSYTTMWAPFVGNIVFETDGEGYLSPRR